MSASSTLVLGFGEPGPLLQKTLESAQVSYTALPGVFSDLHKAQPAFWRSVQNALEKQQPDLVVWAQNSLILWDRLERALALNHQPDFLWPLSLELQDGAVTPAETGLFLAVGGFELSLFHFHDLKDFHHAVRGRALAKLLTVADINTMTIGDYLYQSWLNFESVKAPDPWAIAGDQSLRFFGLESATNRFKAEHNLWQMGRVAMEAYSRNTLAAADVARSNLDIMQPRMESLMRRLPYHGFWPLRAGSKVLTLPCSGYHPVVQSLIWRGSYCGKAFDVWNTLFCQGLYQNVLDMRKDGHVFGLLFAAQNPTGNILCVSPSLDSAARAKAAAEANGLNLNIVLDRMNKTHEGIAVVEENDDALWGKMDVFIPFDSAPQHIQKRAIPPDYVALLCSAHEFAVTALSDLSSIQEGSALLLLRKESAAKLTGGRL